VLFHILSGLSEKFGTVLKMRPLYKWYYLAEGLVVVALITHLFQAGAALSTPGQVLNVTNPMITLIFYHTPMALAVTLALGLTWKYWGWLITERK